MRPPSFLLAVALFVSVPLACSSSSSSDNGQPGSPDGSSGSSSSGGSSGTPGDEGGSTSSGGVDANKPQYVKTTNETFMVDGAQRMYILSVPLDYDATKKYPVYMFMHGNPGHAQDMLQIFPVDPATKNEAVIVYPQSLVGDGWDHTAVTTDNADSDYLKALPDEIAKKASIDKSRIFLTGWSGGGFMASEMACRFSSLFKAIGVYSGGAPYDPNATDPNSVPACAGAQIATYVEHGAADTEVDPSSGDFAGQYWAQHDGCTGGTTDATPSPCKKYQGCPADKPVGICMIPGLGHAVWDQGHAAAWAWFKSLP